MKEQFYKRYLKNHDKWMDIKNASYHKNAYDITTEEAYRVVNINKKIKEAKKTIPQNKAYIKTLKMMKNKILKKGI